MNTQELTEALARLNQDGETAIAKAAQIELEQLTTRIAELESVLETSIEIAITYEQVLKRKYESPIRFFVGGRDFDLGDFISHVRTMLAKVQS